MTEKESKNGFMSRYDFVLKTIDGLVQKIKGILRLSQSGKFILDTADTIQKGDIIEDSTGHFFTVTKVQKEFHEGLFYCYHANLKQDKKPMLQEV